MNVNHSIIAKTFKEMNSLVWGTRWKGNKWGKGSMCLTLQYIIFLCKRSFQKGWYIVKETFERTLNFWQWKLISLCNFVKNVWFKHLPCIYDFKLWFLQENNFCKKYCSTWWRKQNSNMFCKIFILQFYNYEFWLVNV